MGKFIDLTGNRYGRLVIVERAESRITNSGQTKTMWKCLCDCGNTKIIAAADLKSGRVNSCGCLKKELLAKRNFHDISGKKFGKITVVSFYGFKNGRSLWNCKCECGTECVYDGHTLLANHISSCGCGKKTHNLRHGMSGTRLYRIWTGMKTRCENQNADNYKYYGERGISVCDEWKEDFDTFAKWALKTGYKDSLTIDRINVNGNYEPKNCRWVTMAEQNKNKRG